MKRAVALRWALSAIVVLSVAFGLVLGIPRLRHFADAELTVWTTSIVAKLTSSLGFDATGIGNILSLKVRSITITRKCTGLDGLLIEWAVILTAPTVVRWRLVGALLALPAVFVVNTARLTTLGIAGTYSYGFADVIDYVFWPIVYVAIMLAATSLWYRSRPTPDHVPPRDPSTPGATVAIDRP